MAYASSPFPSTAEIGYIRQLEQAESLIETLEAENATLRAEILLKDAKFANQQALLAEAVAWIRSGPEKAESLCADIDKILRR